MSKEGDDCYLVTGITSTCSDLKPEHAVIPLVGPVTNDVTEIHGHCFMLLQLRGICAYNITRKQGIRDCEVANKHVCVRHRNTIKSTEV